MLIKLPDTILISGFQICQLQKGLKYCCSALEIKVVTIGCKKTPKHQFRNLFKMTFLLSGPVV